MITKHPTSRTIVVRIIGNLDALRAEHFRQQLRSLIDEGYRYIIFDLEDSPYMNSSGLGLLVEIYNRVNRMSGSFKLINCKKQIVSLLQQTHLDQLFLDQESEVKEEEEPEAPQPQFDQLHALMSDEILLLTHINRIAEQTLPLDNPSQIAEIALKGVVEALHANQGVFYVLNEREDRLRLLQWAGRPADDNGTSVEDVALKHGRLEQKILDCDEIVLCNIDEAEEKIEDRLFRHLGFSTMLAASIRGRQRRYGLLAIDASQRTVEILKAARPLVQTAADICGLALEKTWVMEQLNQKNKELSESVQQTQKFQNSLIEAGNLTALGVVVSGLSHLLNNKMVPLLGYTQMLSRYKNLPENVARKLEMIHRSGNEMNEVMEKLIRVSRLRDHVREVIDLADLIQTALDLLSQYVAQHAVHIEVDRPESAYTIGDPDLLLQAMVVVLHRSCTSFPSEQDVRCVRIETQTKANRLRIFIEDNSTLACEEEVDGDWIDPLLPSVEIEQGRIFSFMIPRSIVRRHGGNFIVEPCDGGGNRVTIELPLSTVADISPAHNPSASITS